MRIAVPLCVVLSACAGGAGFTPKPLPELVATGSPLAPLDTSAFELRAGESLAWNVAYQGLTLGRVELAIGEQEVRTRFETGMLASSISAAKYELVTVVDRAAHRPMGARELIELEGEATSTDASFDGKSFTIAGQAHAVPDGDAHTLHTALAAIRGWASPKKQGGVLYVVHAGKPYKLVLSRPIPEALHGTPAIKVSGRVVPAAGSGGVISFAMWIADTDSRPPLRVEVAADGKTLTAELIDA